MSLPIETRISTARAELEETLDAIEDKLNVPKQVGNLTRKAKKAYRENPVPWIIGATAAVIAVGGLIAWAVLTDD
ncbi:DUF3618 domain-containing protein [Glaciihabitans sp. UYNi722]|uniref:DUF3618 domain-containing protein n=1 Tax=Glaciihabitans sp. UYNi722 TaxID=3156344 RepID=UPI0033988A52